MNYVEELIRTMATTTTPLYNHSEFLLLDDNNESIENTIVPVELRDPLYIVIPITIIYVLILLSGVIGNVSTCIVIAKNKSMHTATNYYLFSLAVSDLLLLVSGLPPEMYRLWWPQVYTFGEVFCTIQSFSAETSTNATVLTITAFTVERYIAICHPFLTHTMSKLSRAVRFVLAIWLLALCLAVPQAIQYGMWYAVDETGAKVSRCTITRLLVQHAFELSTFLFFVGPMTVITVLYVLIALKLRHSRLLAVGSRSSNAAHSFYSQQQDVTTAVIADDERRRRCVRSTAAQNRVVKMLVAVVVAFFVCWAPFHAQRLLAVYMTNIYSQQQPDEFVLTIYLVLNYTSGVLYFLSTTINPLLYNIMSNKFREAFKSTLSQLCDRHSRHSAYQQRMRTQSYTTLSRYPLSCRRQNSRRTTLVQTEYIDITDQPPNSIPLKRQYSRPRDNSMSSQNTVLTSLSKSLPKNGVKTHEQEPQRTSVKKYSHHINNNNSYSNNKKSSDSSDNDVSNNNSRSRFRCWVQRVRTFLNFKYDEPVQRNEKCFTRNRSVESANTISNSSLQDLDEIEFSSSDLIKYMEEVNQDLS